MKMTSKIEATLKMKMTSILEIQFGGRDIFYDLVDLNEKITFWRDTWTPPLVDEESGCFNLK